MKKKIEKKKISKKMLMFGIVGIFSIMLVTAGLVAYYDLYSKEITVESPIVLSGESSPELVFMNTDIRGEPITITNLAEGDIDVELTYEADEGINVTYLAELELYAKETVNWTEIGDPKEILYTIIGEEFIVENENSEIVINYIEPAEPYTGNFRLSTDITSSFTGQKFWLVPSDSDINEDKALDSWTPTSYYCEHELVDYTKGDSGIFTMPGDSSIVLIPIYHVGMYEGTTNVETIANAVI